MDPVSPVIDKSMFFTPAAPNDHIIGLTGISFWEKHTQIKQGIPELLLYVRAGSDGDTGWRRGPNREVELVSSVITVDQPQVIDYRLTCVAQPALTPSQFDYG